jgi:hypothetical protein
MTQPLFTSVGPIEAANADAICEAETPDAGPIDLTGSSVVDALLFLMPLAELKLTPRAMNLRQLS